MRTLQGGRAQHQMIQVSVVDAWLDLSYPPKVVGKVRNDMLMECPACGALWNQSTQRWERLGDQDAMHYMDRP